MLLLPLLSLVCSAALFVAVIVCFAWLGAQTPIL
jgi:hypothetical protein